MPPGSPFFTVPLESGCGEGGDGERRERCNIFFNKEDPMNNILHSYFTIYMDSILIRNLHNKEHTLANVFFMPLPSLSHPVPLCLAVCPLPLSRSTPQPSNFPSPPFCFYLLQELRVGRQYSLKFDYRDKWKLLNKKCILRSIKWFGELIIWLNGSSDLE